MLVFCWRQILLDGVPDMPSIKRDKFRDLLTHKAVKVRFLPPLVLRCPHIVIF